MAAPPFAAAGNDFAVCVTRAAGFGACFADYRLECALTNDPAVFQN